jgi:HD-GYP domain-containing protein (c-di-GMP phosphodiesterase class II)
MLTQRLGEAMDRQLKYKELAASYLDMLKMMVKAVDDLETYSVGHSQLISRYSGIIAKELQMDSKQIQEIMLAGYLHDVGMLGLSGEIIFKTGKYTDVEQEAMKLHAEVGASIIESIVSNSTVASYIRYHHERWDGYGYPHSLKGQEIPIGARIIAVVDTFCAKLAGRKNREPVAFDKAIADLQAAVGTQLDPNLVSKLVSWFERKRANTTSKDKPLGACWEMRCCPSNISQFCAAYQNTGQNCWDLEQTNCAAHGNTCPTCIVFTEFMYRLQITNKG